MIIFLILSFALNVYFYIVIRRKVEKNRSLCERFYKHLEQLGEESDCRVKELQDLHDTTKRFTLQLGVYSQLLSDFKSRLNEI